MSRDLKVYLEDILEAIQRIQTYTAGITFEQFVNDNMRIDAVSRNIQVIGQATKQIPDELRNQYPSIKWTEIIGMRNLVVHEYFEVNTEIIWSAIQTRLPELREIINQMLEDDDAANQTNAE